MPSLPLTGWEKDPGLRTAAPRLLLSVQSCPSGAQLLLQGPPGLSGLHGKVCEVGASPGQGSEGCGHKFDSSSSRGSDSKASVYNVRDLGSIPGLGRFPGEGNGNPLQYYSCLENPMDGGAWSMGLQRVGFPQVSFSFFLASNLSLTDFHCHLLHFLELG